MKMNKMLVPLIALVGAVVLFLFATEGVYDWVKAFHIIAVIAWMAGMLYLPRLFVYHSDAEVGSDKSETFKIMERRLYSAIIMPSMLATWVLGLWLAWKGFGFQGGWLHTKIALVVALSGVHGFLGGSLRKFERDANTRSAGFWRVMNEVPTVLLLLIVILVAVKPF